ncbi:MAG: ATP-grasp domain-containing protein [Alphaproteobacteria bacterium]|nr:ATP-grasp domain-containing protein [Alphaproteobacteria bacterium]MDE2265915.1 ATP-grasp domain-containing protein [Alphaproteobacteria bacterium]MDE2499663.1 ATP-grasp domain-containing protein [Alphaproteobacteria bacterium]
MFQKILIANRGEIACRIMRTARVMGIGTVAVYSDADADSAHVAAADDAVRIGPAPARESYLRVDAILAAAKATGAEAIHPGYGFLSENADFADACAVAGIVFIGPPADAIRAMGLKDRAKALMEKAGVPVVPGYHGADQTGLKGKAGKIGYPVLIKAAAGGGGKGMRRVDVAEDFEAALESAQREAKSAFGDDRVLIEKYVSQPRHVEVQVFADQHGHVLHLLERDCSLQRRHQKVIEEAPAPGMTEAMRAQIGAIAVKAAQAVGYVGAGTVEFIADASKGLRPDRIWFMEMNTRLQVEHPVTEAVTGIDLVEWQLRVASGEALFKRQNDIRPKGHAVEVRLYAEDPPSGFLPSTGTLERLVLPDSVRVDAGVREGDAVTAFYDPMIAKVIAHDATRAGAIAKLAGALTKVEIAGLRTNNAFLVRTLRHPDFISGDIDTGFIPRHIEELAPQTPPSDDVLAAAARYVLGKTSADTDADPWSNADSFRLAGPARQVMDFVVDGKHRRVAIPAPSAKFTTQVLRLANGDLAAMDKGETFVLHLHDPLHDVDTEGEGADRILAPMPGKIIQVHVQAGQAVRRGDPLVILEAMKMEHTLSAPRDTTVETVDAVLGDQITEGAVLVRFAGEAP